MRETVFEVKIAFDRAALKCQVKLKFVVNGDKNLTGWSHVSHK